MILFATGIEYWSEDITLPGLIFSKNVYSISFIWQSTLSPTVADLTF
jgi:hypothetical protein